MPVLAPSMGRRPGGQWIIPKDEAQNPDIKAMLEAAAFVGVLHVKSL